MAGQISINESEMRNGATNCSTLAAELDQCRTRIIQICDTLIACGWQGVAANEFESYVKGPAAKHLADVSEMCEQTSRTLINTCEQFTSADQTLSNQFRV